MSTDRPEAQRLAIIGCLNEEAGEIVQVVGKIMRHGEQATDTHVVGDGRTYDNLADLQTECGQLVGAIRYAVDRGLLNVEALEFEAEQKRRKLRRIHG